MEAGSETRVLKELNLLQSKEVFFFLSYIILCFFTYPTKNSDLLSFVQKGILNPVLSGFIFLFMHLCTPVFQPHHLTCDKYSNSFQLDYQVLSINTSKVEGDLRKNVEYKTPHKTISSKWNASPRHSSLKEIPGFISAEAPSSQLDLTGNIASNSYTLNQIPRL